VLHPSRFLKELPPELMEDADARDKHPLNPDAGKKCSTSSAAPFSEAMLKAEMIYL
jgi:hypothetical protein